MKYSDLNRKNIKEITNSKDYLKAMEEIIYNQFLNYISKKDNGFDKTIKEADKRFIKKQVIANISRNLWSNEDYYRIMIDDDKYINTGLKIIENSNYPSAGNDFK